MLNNVKQYRMMGKTTKMTHRTFRMPDTGSVTSVIIWHLEPCDDIAWCCHATASNAHQAVSPSGRS